MRLARLTRSLSRPPRAMPHEAPPPPPPPPSLAFVSATDLRAKLADGKGKRPLVVDVRDESEKDAAIAGALHVPAHKLRGDGPEADAALDDIVRCVACGLFFCGRELLRVFLLGTFAPVPSLFSAGQ